MDGLQARGNEIWGIRNFLEICTSGNLYGFELQTNLNTALRNL
jgi:hypothetical protein